MIYIYFAILCSTAIGVVLSTRNKHFSFIFTFLCHSSQSCTFVIFKNIDLNNRPNSKGSGRLKSEIKKLVDSKIIYVLLQTSISTHNTFWNNLHQVCLQLKKKGQVIYSLWEQEKPIGFKGIANIAYGYRCMWNIDISIDKYISSTYSASLE